MACPSVRPARPADLEQLGARSRSRPVSSEIGSELAAQMDHEASLPGIDASRRCAMVKDI